MTPEGRAYLAAYRASVKAAKARADLPAGSSRARVTTANARWKSAAEERDRLEAYVKPDELKAIRSRIAKEAA